MTILLDDEKLLEWCGVPLQSVTPDKAYELVCRMGGLARWWLRPEIMAAANQFAAILPAVQQAHWQHLFAAELPEGVGACWPIFVNTSPQQLPLLRSSMVFPLRWEQRETHDERLPPTLTLLADLVRAQASRASENVGNLRLAPATSLLLSKLDLSSLSLRCESAWASLAGGLVIACRHGRPNPRVWVSAQWRDGRGLEAVAGLADKISLIQEMGGAALFVPRQQALDAANSVPFDPLSPEIESLNEIPGPERPMDAIRAYLDKHWLTPTSLSTREERVGYFLRYFAHADAARPWYIEHCLAETVEDLRKALANKPNLQQVTHLVIDLSPSFELIAMAIAVLRPLRCALIVDPNMRGQVETVKQLIARFVPPGECTVRHFQTEGQSVGELLHEYRRILQVFTQGVSDPRQLLIDISPGYKHCNITMLRAAPAGCQVMYYAGDFDKATRRTIPFTIRPEIWINKSE